MTAAASATADLPTVEHALREPRLFGTRSQLPLLGILQNGVLPSLGIHSGLSIITYGIARSTNRLDLKDWLWPSGMVLNAWWTAYGRHSLPSSHATLGHLSFSQKCLLGAVTAWGGRLFFRIVTRSLQRGKDDSRYEGVRTQPGFWNKAALLFGLEAVFQTLISIPFTLPFCADSFNGFTGASPNWAPTIRWTAAGLFTAGLALETLADWQLDAHKTKVIKQQEQGQQHGEMLRTGVWSIVRHPNYFGDALCHAAFPLWCYGSQLFNYTHIIGPLANYLFLRWIGGDRENEAYQLERYRKEDRHKHAQLELYQLQKHAFWPSLFEIANPWTWVVTGVGALGAAAEYLYEWKIVTALTSVNPVDPVLGETLAALE